jgi:hypothetical protein
MFRSMQVNASLAIPALLKEAVSRYPASKPEVPTRCLPQYPSSVGVWDILAITWVTSKLHVQPSVSPRHTLPLTSINNHNLQPSGQILANCTVVKNKGDPLMSCLWHFLPCWAHLNDLSSFEVLEYSQEPLPLFKFRWIPANFVVPFPRLPTSDK